MRFSDESRNIHVRDLKVLPSDAASFEPSQSPLSFKEKLRARSSAPESTRKRHRALPKSTPPEDTAAEGTAARGTSTKSTAADSDSDCDECPVCLEVLDAATAVLNLCMHVFCATCNHNCRDGRHRFRRQPARSSSAPCVESTSSLPMFYKLPSSSPLTPTRTL